MENKKELIKLVKKNGFYLDEKMIEDAKKFNTYIYICQSPDNDGGWTIPIYEAFPLNDYKKLSKLCKEIGVEMPFDVIVDKL